MAYDEALAERIRNHFGDDPDVAEMKMFGGIAYMFRGNMAVGIHGDGLMVRLGDGAASAIDEPGASVMTMGGKPMKGFLVIDAGAIADDATLTAWIDRGVEFAASLPPK